jgi:hypothetical protein
MDADGFSEYIERTLATEKSVWRGGRQVLYEKEELAWGLHNSAAPTGSVLLGEIVEVCREKGWGESDIGRFAEWALAHCDGEDDGSGSELAPGL